MIVLLLLAIAPEHAGSPQEAPIEERLRAMLARKFTMTEPERLADYERRIMERLRRFEHDPRLLEEALERLRWYNTEKWVLNSDGLRGWLPDHPEVEPLTLPVQRYRELNDASVDFFLAELTQAVEWRPPDESTRAAIETQTDRLIVEARGLLLRKISGPAAETWIDDRLGTLHEGWNSLIGGRWHESINAPLSAEAMNQALADIGAAVEADPGAVAIVGPDDEVDVMDFDGLNSKQFTDLSLDRMMMPLRNVWIGSNPRLGPKRKHSRELFDKALADLSEAREKYSFIYTEIRAQKNREEFLERERLRAERRIEATQDRPAPEEPMPPPVEDEPAPMQESEVIPDEPEPPEGSSSADPLLPLLLLAAAASVVVGLTWVLRRWRG